MTRDKSEPRVRHKRIWLSLLGAVVCVAVIGLLWQIYFVQSINPPAHPPAQPSVAPQPLQPSSYQRTRRRFGPWQLATPNTTGAPHLVMLRANGGVEVSSTIVHVNRNWRPDIANEIESVAPGDRTVRIRVFNNDIDALQYGQAFVLAPRPEVVYSFLPNGPGKAQLMSTTVAALSKR